MNNELPRRKSTRLKEFDYSGPGYYFLTICTHQKRILFGEIVNSKMKLNKCGLVVKEIWNSLPNYYSNLELDYYSIMPDHFHAIIIMNGPVKLKIPRPEIKTDKFTLSQIIGYFKYQSTKEINKSFGNPGDKIWQRSFFDRIIRNERELYKIRKYIEQNSLKWALKNRCAENLNIG